MAKILDLNEMIKLADVCELPNRNEFISELERIGTALAQSLATHLKVETTYADNQPGSGGLCAPFYAKTKRQKMPVELLEFDQGGDWETNPLKERKAA